jgi:rare lipoprotein A
MHLELLYVNPPLCASAPRLGGVCVLLAAALAGCSQAPNGKRSKEFFPTSIYGATSPKVVEDGAPVPRGGGRYLVGKPYTIAGRVYTPKEVAPNASQTGKASWYGAAFHGRRTSNGEVYDMRSVSAAHPTWPLPSYVRVTNTGNGRSMIVRLNDRGPFHSSRIMDVSSRVAEALDFKRMGTASIIRRGGQRVQLAS